MHRLEFRKCQRGSRWRWSSSAKHGMFAVRPRPVSIVLEGAGPDGQLQTIDACTKLQAVVQHLISANNSLRCRGALVVCSLSVDGDVVMNIRQDTLPTSELCLVLYCAAAVSTLRSGAAAAVHMQILPALSSISLDC